MKLTLSWLKQHLETDADLATLSARLTMFGLEVDSIDRIHIRNKMVLNELETLMDFVRSRNVKGVWVDRLADKITEGKNLPLTR